ncbi:MAG TPA: glycosyltransferase family 4 protein [Solirubrobacterales bacterium]|nr:glycosyltransferase family 4 protein [Solirubrobacterales bacterium]
MADQQWRVLLACDFFLRYTSMLAGGLSRAGASVALLSRDHEEEFGGRPGAAAEFVAAAAGPAVRRSAITGRVRSPVALGGALRARRDLRGFGADVVHLQESIGNDLRLIYASGARPRRFALTIHDPVRHPGDDASRSSTVGNRWLIRAAGLIFVHGAALRDELAEVARPEAPIVVVPHGVDPVASEPRPLPSRPSILFFGRLGHYKGIDVLLDAMAVIWAEQPQAALTIAGAGELPDHPALADPRVELRHEHVPDAELPELFAAATCVVLPYRQASQSGVGALAKRYGRGLVVSAVGGLPELVADGSGLTVPAEDPVALARGLLGPLGDRSLAERLGRAGHRTAVAGADWDSVAATTLAAYEEHLLVPRRVGGR